MQIIGQFIFVFGVIRLIVACINWIFNKQSWKPVVCKTSPSLSILIPARNEEENIRDLLSDLIRINYPVHEIIVYDDNSADRTVEIVKEFARVRLIEGKEPEKGWLGKNYACHQLALAAQGEKILFLDADVRISDPVIEKILCYLETKSLSLLSVFPQQLFPSTGSRFTIPLMNWILLSLLPLPLIPATHIPSLAAANGQCMLFDAKTYRRHLPHQKFRMNPVEDIRIMQYYKSRQLKTATLLGDPHICCHMYGSWKEAIRGFSKNIFAFFGNSKIAAYMFASLTTIAPFVIFHSHGKTVGMVYLGIILLIRIFFSLASHQSVLQNILFSIPQQFSFWVILLYATIHHKQKN
ncbi:MAG: glycosyltransferase family 2 protein [Tannerellaceae bacterium]|nr:glycosyltransferase family 2 protein [Tannerellaceae bacterium]